MIRKIWLISKFITSQHGQQRIAIYILPNISRSNGNQTFGQLKEYSKRNILLENHAKNEAGRLVPDFFLFFLKKIYFR